MDKIGEVLQKISLATTDQAANDILWADDKKSWYGAVVTPFKWSSPLTVHFQSWVTSHENEIQEKHILGLARAVQKVNLFKKNEDVTPLINSVNTLFQKKFNLRDMAGFLKALELFPKGENEAPIADILLPFFKNSEKSSENPQKNQIDAILEILKLVPQGKRNVPLLSNIITIVKETTGDSQGIRDALKTIALKDRASVLSVVTPVANNKQIVEIIKKLGVTPEEKELTIYPVLLEKLKRWQRTTKKLPS